MTTLYGLKNCDSCRKALKAILAAGADAELIDVRENPPSKKMLTQWCKIFGRDTLVNRRSTTWRGLSDEEKELSSDQIAVALLQIHPTLMKRPVIIQDGVLLLGFNADTIKALQLNP